MALDTEVCCTTLAYHPCFALLLGGFAVRISTHVANAIEAAGRSTESRFTHRIRVDALEAGWEPEAAKTLRVRHREGSVHVDHDAHDWEYGTEDRPPLAVSRQFLHRVDEHADPHFEDELLRALGGLL